MLRILNYIEKYPDGKVISNTASTVIVKGINTGIRLIILFLIAKTVSPERYGDINYVISLVELIRGVADLGVDAYTLRMLATSNQKDSTKFIIESTLGIKIILASFSFIVFFIVCNLNQEPIIWSIIIGLLIFSGLLNNLFINFFQAELTVYKLIIPVLVINIPVVAIIIISSRILEQNTELLIISLPLAEILFSFYLFFKLSRFLGALTTKFSIIRLISTLKSSLPIAITSILVVIYTRLDVIVLKSFSSPLVLGYYGTAFRITEPFVLMMGAFSLSIYSHFSKLASTSTSLSKPFIRYIFITLGYGILSSLSILFLGPWLIRHFLPNYQGAIPILVILAIALAFRTFNSFLTSVLYSLGHFSKVTLAASINLFLVFIFLIRFIPIYGGSGAAFSLLTVEIINMFVQAYMLNRSFSARRGEILVYEE